jgi:hypothetical protein
MDVVEIRFRPCDGDFPLDAVIEKLLNSFRGANVTQDDWYGNFRRTFERATEDRKKSGRPMAHPDAILNDIDSAARSAGVRKILAIPMAEGGCLKGDITQHRLVLIADTELENNETVKAIADLLSSLSVVAHVQ